MTHHVKQPTKRPPCLFPLEWPLHMTWIMLWNWPIDGRNWRIPLWTGWRHCFTSNSQQKTCFFFHETFVPNTWELNSEYIIWVNLKLYIYIYMGLSINRGTPKSSILIGFSIIFTIHFGGPTLIFGNTHIMIFSWYMSKPPAWISFGGSKSPTSLENRWARGASYRSMPGSQNPPNWEVSVEETWRWSNLRNGWTEKSTQRFSPKVW